MQQVGADVLGIFTCSAVTTSTTPPLSIFGQAVIDATAAVVVAGHRTLMTQEDDSAHTSPNAYPRGKGSVG